MGEPEHHVTSFLRGYLHATIMLSTRTRAAPHLMSLPIELRQKNYEFEVFKPIPDLGDHIMGNSYDKLDKIDKASFDFRVFQCWEKLDHTFTRRAYKTETAFLGVSRRIRAELVFVVQQQASKLDSFLSFINKDSFYHSFPLSPPSLQREEMTLECLLKSGPLPESLKMVRRLLPETFAPTFFQLHVETPNMEEQEIEKGCVEEGCTSEQTAAEHPRLIAGSARIAIPKELFFRGSKPFRLLDLPPELRLMVFERAGWKPLPKIDNCLRTQKYAELGASEKEKFEEKLISVWNSVTKTFHRRAYVTDVALLGVSKQLRAEMVFVVQQQARRIAYNNFQFLSIESKTDFPILDSAWKPYHRYQYEKREYGFLMQVPLNHHLVGRELSLFWYNLSPTPPMHQLQIRTILEDSKAGSRRFGMGTETDDHDDNQDFDSDVSVSELEGKL